MKYIDVILTEDGFFCIAPPWTVKEGDYISLENVLTGATELKRVIVQATDRVDGDLIKFVEAYIKGKPTRVTKRYREGDLHWEDKEDVSE